MMGTAVAGIPIVHHAPDGVAVRREIVAGWPGSRVTDEPIRIHHEVGDTSAEGLDPIVDAPPPLGTYYRDAAGHLAVRSRGRGGYLPQLLRTSRPGYDYSLRYESVDDAARMQWGWQRTIFMFALTARGRGVAAHACGFLLPDGRGVLAPGISGSGKSTLARSLSQDAPGDVTVLGDDRIAVTEEPDGFRVWGTPWHSTARLASPLDGPLAAIVLVRHGRESAVRPVAPREVARALLRTLAFPFWDEALMAAVMQQADRIATSVPGYEFAYAPEPGAVRALLSALEAPSLAASAR